jgi:hypothetical protein
LNPERERAHGGRQKNDDGANPSNLSNLPHCFLFSLLLLFALPIPTTNIITMTKFTGPYEIWLDQEKGD